MNLTAPELVGVAHGTRDPRGPEVVEALMDRVRRLAPELTVTTAYVELSKPVFADVARALGRPAVVVPLLLSRGFHLRHDVPATARLSGHPVTVAPGLGPDARLAEVLNQRLGQAGVAPEDAVVVVAAGSRDPRSLADLRRTELLLAERRPGRVTLATLSGCGPSVADAVARLRVAGHRRIAAAPYLLAPGHFLEVVRSVSRHHGIDAVADVLGDHDLVAELVIDRYHHGGRHAAIPHPALPAGRHDHVPAHVGAAAAAS